MTVPLTVRVGDLNVTRSTDDLTSSKNVHGAGEASFGWASPLASRVAPFDRVTVYDSRSADTVWEGRLEDPGRSAGDDGDRWDMSAIGEQARTRDRAAALIYIDTDLSRWLRIRLSRATSADASATDLPTATGTDALLMQYNPGQPIDDFSSVDMAYSAIEEAGMQVGGIEYMAVAGIGSVNFEYRLFAQPSGTQVRNDAWSTTELSRFATQGGTSPLPAGTTSVELRAPRVSGGATNVASDDRWAAFYGVVVKAARYNLDGSLNTTQADYASGRMVYAHEVVTDLLVRLMSAVYDVPSAVIDTSSTFAIDQLAYPDGATVEQVLSDLMDMLPDWYWQIGPSNPATGKATFTWRKWPTSVRYEASLVDGLTLPGADAERYNRVTVRWTDRRGRIQTKSYAAGTTISGTFVPAVPALDAQGLVREPEVQDLADEVGSVAAADKLAAEFLLAHNTPPVSGTLRVARRIEDKDTGRWVHPWEIQPGHLVRIRELVDSPDDLAENGRDGKCVFRIVGRRHTVADNAADLELDAPPRTDEVLLAEQISKRKRKR